MNSNNHRKRKSKKGKIKLSLHRISKSTSVPEANIIDLRKIVAQRKEEEKSVSLKTSLKDRLKDIFQGKEEKFPSYSLESYSDKLPRASLINWQKSITIFVLVCLLLISPIYILKFFQKTSEVKGRVLGASVQAYSHLQSAQEAAQELNFDQADREFSSAIENFILAQGELNKINKVLATILSFVPGGTQVLSGKYLLEAGKNISEAGQAITQALEPLVKLDFNQRLENFQAILSSSDLTAALVISHQNLEPALEKLSLARQNLKKVRIYDLPRENRDQIVKIKEDLPRLESELKQFLDLSGMMLKILGQDSPKRYLFLLENNAELRPTGGFIGTLALIDIDKGQVQQIEVPGGGVYDIAGQLTEKVIAPRPLWLVNPHWNLQDANWFPDFPTSVEKIIWFFEKSGGPSVDGVIALTPDVIEDLLEIVGSIDMTDDYGVIVEAENFREVTQKEAEKKYEEAPESKKFIADLTPILLNRVFNLKSDSLLVIIDILNKNLKAKNLLFYFNDSELQQEISQWEWSGEIKDTEKDYLAVINTNISGGKTDQAIDELIDHQTEIWADGSIIDTVTVTRIHKGESGDPWTGMKNIDYMRFYVPQGSILMEARGFEEVNPQNFKFPKPDYSEDNQLKEIEGEVIIHQSSGMRINQEFGKTVFGNWVQVEPGQSTTVSIKYLLPFKIKAGGLINQSDNYSLLVQKQPGSKGSLLINTLQLPSNFDLSWVYPEDNLVSSQEKTLKFESVLSQDQYLGVVLK